MTDLDKFYKLAKNILDYEPKHIVFYDRKLEVAMIYLGVKSDFQIQFAGGENEICLYLDLHNFYRISKDNLKDLNKIIEILQDNLIGKDLLKGIE